MVEHICRFKTVLSDALSRHWYKLKDLYDAYAVLHPEAASHVSFRSIRSFMKVCRKKHYPPSPHTVREFVDRLVDPVFARNLEYDNGRLSVRLIIDNSGAQHALFFDKNFVRQEMAEVSRLLIDGTFCSRPRIDGVYQLLTIMGIKLNHGFPFIWVIMTSKTQNAYEACLQYVKTHILHAHNILLVMSDFERALRNAVLKAFPTALSTGCNTHHDRAIYKKARALHLQNLFRTNAEAKSFFKKLLALAYLPADHIANQFETIKNSLTPTVRRQLNPLCDYYARYWLGIVKPEGFSVYGLSCRTNNIVESYHSRLKHRIEARPGPWDFVCKLLKLQANVRSDIEHLKNNVPIGRHARYSTVFKQKKLIKAWRELHMLEITVNEFIEKAVALKGNIEIIMANHEDMQENDEAHEHELQETPSVNPLDPDFEREIFSEEPPRWLLDNSITFQENEQVMPIVIDDDSDASSLVSNANNEDVGNLLLGDEERRTFPQPNIIENQPILIDDDSDASSLDRNANPLPRQRREEITPDPPTSSTTQALKKQKRNKRRKDMRRRAIVRRQDGSNSGNIELEQQLSTAGNRLQNMQNNVCKVCLLTSATHIYWPCGHCCCCSTCADILWNEYRERRCPICRTVASEAPRRVFQPEDF
ncbi:uncharacterized protein [Venturia canescens]|uniref:uncharacterized protein isoform X2 n=1 Tax=Venturia canescens TaxID=32260 RepID=UPI001C9D3AF0|nr:uncharacterized protein LOC122414858 isoform X2 [Venturia canescens]